MAGFRSIEAMAVMGVVDTYLRWKDRNGPPRGYEHYHPSAFGKCLRLMQYQRYSERGYIPFPEDFHEPHIVRIFGNGHSMHDRWRSYFEEIGILRGYWECLNPLCAATKDDGSIIEVSPAEISQNPLEWLKKRRIYGKDHLQGCFKPDKCVCGWKKFHYHETDVVSKQLNFAGHADIILDFSRFNPEMFTGVNPDYKMEDLPEKPIVVDMKTINHYDFQEVAKGKADEDYLVQLMIYANILDCEYGILIYENKNNQKTTCFRVDRDAETLFELVKRQARMMNEMVEEQKLPPPRHSPLSDECKYCKYRPLCHVSPIWSDPNLDEIRREFYGELLKESHDDRTASSQLQTPAGDVFSYLSAL